MILSIKSDITLNQDQIKLATKLTSVSDRLKQSYLSKIFKRKTYSGIYIHGSVGSGKTMLLRAFFDHTKCKKMIVHFKDFMRDIHSSIHVASQDFSNIIPHIAKEYSKKIQLLCLDEFEIKDITDAMIIGRLFEALINNDVFIVVTTNIKPENLYMDGLQRELFLPFIDMISKKFEVCTLNSDYDYRLGRVSSKHRLLYPDCNQTKILMQQVVEDLVDINHLAPRELEVFGRKLVLQRTYKTVLITNFEEMCLQKLSYNDYIAICENFKVVIMEDVPQLSSENTDEAIRFINFIDSIYFHHILCFISMATSPEELYISGKYKAEFKRTISRLHEMESDEYFNKVQLINLI